MIEYRDLYDEKRIYTGEFIKKGDIVPKGRYYQTVIIFIENSKGEFLIQLTSVNKGHHYASTGGHPIKGESSIDGIVREVKEELGLSINPSELTLFKTVKTNDDFCDLYYIKKDFEINTFILQEEEVDSVLWATREKIEDLNNNHLFSKTHYKAFQSLFKFLDSDSGKFITHVGVYGIIKEKNKILLIDKVGGPYDGLLDLPGGTIEYKEHIEDTLIREIKEEVGISVTEYHLSKVVDAYVNWIYKGIKETIHHVGIIFEIQKYSGDIKFKNKIDDKNDDSKGCKFYDLNNVDINKLSSLIKKVG